MFKAYWEKGISFNAYVDTIKQKKEFSEKHLLSHQRIHHALENYGPSTDQQQHLQKKNFSGKILIIAEGWCGDCNQAIPVIHKSFGTQNSVKILYRDENPDLMQQFLTNGNMAIPIVIFLNDQNRPVFHWGPRPKHGIEILSKHKNNNENFSKELFLSELHAYYESNKGNDIIDEIISLL
ncbi:hypothetical protein ACM46_06600 [Chryseobacterium angstadtii]|uniref:Thioredoxin n=1 Tax=Chryseobacterium angstadtii TaxID=558151 RepID=A0A0J7IHS7_9FLAO|nr:thioredoxin family protein [Chryseobacterium angstadtii]KMQ65549.1 hypothetical protein ACM46_06600 [Chryseobacterium angstadtii]